MSLPPSLACADTADSLPRGAADGPVREDERIPWIDVVRGFALAGILLANLPLFAGHPYMTAAQRDALPTAEGDHVVGTAVTWLVEDKFMGLFSLLFGVGAALQIARGRARGETGARRYLRRLAWLFAIGAVHGWLAWSWEVLRFYALWGLLLPLCARLRPRPLLALALAAAVVVPAAWRTALAVLGVAEEGPAVDALRAEVLAAFAHGDYVAVVAANWAWDWHLTLSPALGPYQVALFGRMLVGFSLGLWLVRGNDPRPLLRRLLPWCLVAGLAGCAVQAGLVPLPPGTAWRSWPVMVGTLALTLAFLGAVVLALDTGRGRRWLGLLAPVGRMSFTNYLAHTVVGLWLFYGFLPGPGLEGKVGFAALLPLWAAIYGVQVAFSHWWLRRFAIGPCEWVWRSLTYGRLQPWRRAGAAAARRDEAPAPAT